MQTGAYAASGYAVEFDGVDDYIDVNSLEYAFEDGDSFTIELWGKWFDDTRSICVRRYSLQRSRFRTRGTASLSVSTGISNADWNHVAVVYDGSSDTKTITVFVNGAQSGTTSTTASALSSYEADTLRFGMTHHSGGQYSHCIFDEVRIWKVARALSAIQADMKRGLTGNEPGLVGYWPMDEGEGVTATDLSPSGNNGNLVGASWTTDTAPVVPGQVAVLAHGASPAGGAVDVPRDVVLGWAPGNATCTHDVYFGASSSDVGGADRTNPLNVLASQAQDANTYDPPGRLEFGTTYYWRVDEVNVPDSTLSKGKIWSFTTEPLLYSMTNITPTASSSNTGVTPANTVNGSGLDAGGLHSMTDTTMWLSSKTGPQPTWIQYEFDGIYKLEEMWVWNYNVMVEGTLGFGIKDVTVEYSANGTDWTSLGDMQFAQAPAMDGYAHNTTVDFGGVAAKFVRLTVKNNWGGLAPQYGLSEVRFLYTPAHPRQPQPASGETGVNPSVILSWRAGREAASHEVYFSDSNEAVINGTALAATVDTAGYDAAAQNLKLGTTYYWKVVEVNTAETPSAWEGDLWSFETLFVYPVDDFESYTNDSPNRVFQTWVDGWGFSADQYFPQGNDGNGSGAMVGYDPAVGNIMETTIIHGGKQAMPVEYNNVAQPYYSEALRTWETAQNWTVNGSDTLQLCFRGNPIRFAEPAPGSITMSGAGADIWNAADEFTFAWKPLSGNGTITVKVESVENTHEWAKAGVMIRETLDAGSRFAAVYATPGQGVRYQARLLNAGSATSDTSVATDEQKALTAPVWIRIERNGTTFNGYYSTDGAKWTSMSWNPQTITMIGTIYIGIVMTSHASGVGCTGQFSNITMSSGISGAWQFSEIGVDHVLNDPDKLYVALEDSAGHTGVVTHSNPDAVVQDTWQTWNIPLADFRSAGVNTASIKKMYIGVGDRKTPAAGGSGRLYIDNIGYGRPAPGQ